MDTGNGTFQVASAENQKILAEMMKAAEAKYPNHGGWFQVGEIVELKGSTFKVKRIKPTEIVLKLQKRSSPIE